MPTQNRNKPQTHTIMIINIGSTIEKTVRRSGFQKSRPSWISRVRIKRLFNLLPATGLAHKNRTRHQQQRVGTAATARTRLDQPSAKHVRNLTERSILPGKCIRPAISLEGGTPSTRHDHQHPPTITIHITRRQTSSNTDENQQYLRAETKQNKSDLERRRSTATSRTGRGSSSSSSHSSTQQPPSSSARTAISPLINLHIRLDEQPPKQQEQTPEDDASETGGVTRVPRRRPGREEDSSAAAAAASALTSNNLQSSPAVHLRQSRITGEAATTTEHGQQKLDVRADRSSRRRQATTRLGHTGMHY